MKTKLTLPSLPRDPSLKLAACLAVSLLAGTQAFAGYSATTNFVDPDGWVVGGTNSTYQEWDDLQSSTPDIGHSTNPALSSDSTIAPTGSGFATSSGNYYSFSSDYGFAATVYNHGGTSGAGGFASNMGTHIIVQTAATMNEGVGIYPDSIQIVDSLGNSLLGGDNASVLQYSVLFEGIVSSSFGDVTLQEQIWEFYIPNFVDDFQVIGDVKIHASLDRIRIDSDIASSAFSPTTVVPEPSSYAIGLGVIVLGVVLRRRQFKR
ncbi:PEP-CTERM sorting domain-containing protein [Cerasicoccus arenae]|uniref:PEP-CTERM sorting domain-containing protein n=1 Tax=Cerasicoccus arenae TaxID=424488 RepID=A0A8J3GEG6_9BACT|nr:PEP-CTERM sorting domain-containing protein [Cerasicoccus arenae]MBK1858720.1 PEP-CTERM sorting domain-containing protein [Cerasicoccus arenae]GHB98500.1 hypothetical protein GCM10007047_13310 [Cerasicoccus arenae]